MASANGNEDLNQSLLVDSSGRDEDRLSTRIWAESKKLWRIVGPAIFSRVSSFSMNVVTQAFAGHLGEVELASISIANNVLVGFSFGLMLGMASALETLCGQAFGAKRYHMLGIYLQRSWIVLFLFSFLLLPIFIFATPILKLLGQDDAVAEQTGLLALWFIPINFSFAFQLPLQRFLQCQLKNRIVAIAAISALALNTLACWLLIHVLELGVVGAAIALDISWWFMILVLFVYTCRVCPQTWTGFSPLAFSGLFEFFKLSFASGVMLLMGRRM